jgi:opacity protein-like surface antigen
MHSATLGDAAGRKRSGSISANAIGWLATVITSKTTLEMMMNKNKINVIRILFLFLLITIPSVVFAETEITGVFGGMVGGDLNNVIEGDFSVKGTFDNAPLYGGRLGWVGGFIGVEGSFVDSPTGLRVAIPGFPVSLDARVYYLEANFLLIPIPGPISPFFTAGIGLHSYKFEVNTGSVAISGENTDVNKFGYNFGGGLKINIGHITFRGEVLDHVTPIGPGDFSIEDIIPGTAIDTNVRLHNVEISAGIGVRF